MPRKITGFRPVCTKKSGENLAKIFIYTKFMDEEEYSRILCTLWLFQSA